MYTAIMIALILFPWTLAAISLVGWWAHRKTERQVVQRGEAQRARGSVR